MQILHSALVFVAFLSMTAALSMMPANSAQAHSPLKSSTPASGATVQSAPETLQILFENPVIFTSVEVSKEDADIAVEFERSSNAATEHSVPLPSLSEGKYTVSWSALSPEDGHVMQDTFSFTVAAD
ncbi:copper resistance CopC family protein [Fodinicurvata sediminis]|uniref:copper resistance CopC family protein n=1 Tax=Fodinicurvata sediminis TaxID=1121832 RepID=UPI0003B76B6F|nr:copper resistance CopC family protein [Fodinicurvata sediminis]